MLPKCAYRKTRTCRDEVGLNVLTSHNHPRVSWHVKFAPVNEYNNLSMVVQCKSVGASKMGLVECMLSAPTNQSVKFLVNPFENPVVVQFILLYAKTEDECLELYANTSLMVQKILNGFDIDPCRHVLGLNGNVLSMKQLAC